jgi:hypothetical protein
MHVFVIIIEHRATFLFYQFEKRRGEERVEMGRGGRREGEKGRKSRDGKRRKEEKRGERREGEKREIGEEKKREEK